MFNSFPVEILENISSYTGPSRPFLRLVSKYWFNLPKTIMISFEWLVEVFQQKSLELLQLGMNIGCTLNYISFGLSVQTNKLKIIEFMSRQLIMKFVQCGDIKSAKIARWLINRNYHINDNFDQRSQCPIDVVEFLMENLEDIYDHYSTVIAQTNDIPKILHHYNKLRGRIIDKFNL